jgi:hypothetical protein
MVKYYDRVRWLRDMNKRLLKAAPEKRAEMEAEDMHYISGIEKVLNWCTSRGLSVEWPRSQGGSYDPTDKVITVSSSSVPRIQLQVLLHECGHHLIGRPKAGYRFSMGYGATHDLRADSHKIDILDEEFEAWERGWKLGKRLGALKQSDRHEFNRYRVRMLKGYVNWAAGSWA